MDSVLSFGEQPAHEATMWVRSVRQIYAAAALEALNPSTVPREWMQHSGLGCGNPVARANIQPKEHVIDLGSGAGFDSLAAAVEVGIRGRVVGVDMTPEMIQLATRNAKEAGAPNVCFALGDIECLPIEDDKFDVAISNCVFNLCWNKAKAIAEAFRVLRPGGRLVLADIVVLARKQRHGTPSKLSLATNCYAGALPIAHLLRLLTRVGFVVSQQSLARPAHDSTNVECLNGLDVNRFATTNIVAYKVA